MTTPPIPSPYERLIDDDGKVSEIWYRYLTQNQIELSAAATSLASLSTFLTIVAYSPFATQADQEGGIAANSVVASDVQQYHPSASKAWGLVGSANTTVPTIDAGYNVASVTATTDFNVTVTLTVPFSSTAYSVVASPVANAFSTAHSPVEPVTGRTSIAFTIGSTGFSQISFACYGDQ